MQDTIKGPQVNIKKHGEIQLVLHRELGVRPATVTAFDWQLWTEKQERVFKIEMPKAWWEHIWPRLIKEIDDAISNDEPDYIDVPSRIWVRLGDAIAISVYTADVRFHTEYQLGPFHPGCLKSHIKVPLEWWENELDRVNTLIDNAIKFS